MDWWTEIPQTWTVDNWKWLISMEFRTIAIQLKVSLWDNATKNPKIVYSNKLNLKDNNKIIFPLSQGTRRSFTPRDCLQPPQIQLLTNWWCQRRSVRLSLRTRMPYRSLKWLMQCLLLINWFWTLLNSSQAKLHLTLYKILGKWADKYPWKQVKNKMMKKPWC